MAQVPLAAPVYYMLVVLIMITRSALIKNLNKFAPWFARLVTRHTARGGGRSIPTFDAAVRGRVAVRRTELAQVASLRASGGGLAMGESVI
jgi:hypothetical protein